MRNKILTGAAFAAALSGLVGLEGMKTTAYRDIVGVPTICAGTTDGVRMGDTKTLAQCWSIAEAEYRSYEKVVIDTIKVPLNPNQQTALTWLAVNIGRYGFMDSTAAARFNRGDYTGGCHAIRMWNKVTINKVKVVSNGLDNRRKVEETLCLKPYPS